MKRIILLIDSLIIIFLLAGRIFLLVHLPSGQNRRKKQSV